MLLLVGATIEGTNVAAFFNIPAIFIVIGGTMGATLATCGAEQFFQIGQALTTVLKTDPPDFLNTAKLLVEGADLARREGVLKLEDKAKKVDDPFISLAYQHLADGTDEDVMMDVLEAEIEAEHAVMRGRANIFNSAGGYSPTMGIIGTVMGLTHALGMLNTPEKLGPAIASAFMATLYGVSSANLVFLPWGTRLYAYGRERQAYREMIVAGIQAMRRGDAPRQVAERLAALIPGEVTGDDLLPTRSGS